MTDSDPRPQRPYTDNVKKILAYATVPALILAGVTVATSFWSSVAANWSSIVTNLQVELKRAQDDGARTKAELAQTKAEYEIYRQRFASTDNPASGPAPQAPPRTERSPAPSKDVGTARSAATPSKDVGTAKPAATPTQQERVELTNYSKTAMLFNGSLMISLIGVDFGGSPLRHRVTAVVGAPGKPNSKIENQDVGYAIKYGAGKETFEIRLIDSGTSTATFLVTRLPS